MARITLRQLLDHAAERGYGLPAFNVNNMEQILAIMNAAAEELQLAIAYLQASLEADAVVDLFGDRSGGIVAPIDFACSGVQCVDVGAVVVGDSGRRVDDAILDDHSPGDRPS